MKKRNITVTLLLLILLCSIPKARAESLSVAAYQQQLQGIVTNVESLETHPENAGTVVASIPDQVSVTTSSGEIKVSYKVLKDSLAAFTAADESKRPALLRQAQQYARAMNSAAEEYDKRAVDPALHTRSWTRSFPVANSRRRGRARKMHCWRASTIGSRASLASWYSKARRALT